MFVDGGFWHGHPSRFPRPGLSAYWLSKVARNVQRDERTNEDLAKLGWTVVRLWDFELRRDGAACVAKVAAAIQSGLATNPTRERRVTG